MHKLTLSNKEFNALSELFGKQQCCALEASGLWELAHQVREMADARHCSREECGALTDTLYNSDYCYACHIEYNIASQDEAWGERYA